MSFYQVNQKMSFEREFNNGYLCCPNGSYGGWPLMKDLKTGDILFHYNSTCGVVLGISKVIDIGRHKVSHRKPPASFPARNASSIPAGICPRTTSL